MIYAAIYKPRIILLQFVNHRKQTSKKAHKIFSHVSVSIDGSSPLSAMCLSTDVMTDQ